MKNNNINYPYLTNEEITIYGLYEGIKDIGDCVNYDYDSMPEFLRKESVQNVSILVNKTLTAFQEEITKIKNKEIQYFSQIKT